MIKELKKGFTLIELLIVMVIMAILVAIVIGLIGQSATNRAKDTEAKAAMKEVSTALEMYKADNNAYPTGDADAVVAELSAADYIAADVFSCESCGEIGYAGGGDTYDLTYITLSGSETYVVSNKQ